MRDSVEQIDAMRAGVDYRFPIRIRQFAFEVRPLSILETVQVAQKVAESIRAAPESARNRLTEHTFLAKETLIVASTPDVGVNKPQITDYILDRMTNDELQFAYNQYVGVIDRANPQLELMSSEDLDALIADLKKNPEEGSALVFRLTELSLSQLMSIAHFFLTKGD